jgi:hypothetical protein
MKVIVRPSRTRLLVGILLAMLLAAGIAGSFSPAISSRSRNPGERLPDRPAPAVNQSPFPPAFPPARQFSHTSTPTSSLGGTAIPARWIA